MRTSLTVISILAIGTAASQTPIAQARDLPIGTSVTVRGIVTNGPELGGIRYLQDATGAIAAFPGPGSIPGFAPRRGSDVSIAGPLKLFNGLLEIDPVNAFTVHATGQPLPAPQLIPANAMGETNESELVRINACTISGPGGSFTSGTRTFSTASGTGVLFLRSGHPLVGTPIPTGVVDVVGVVSRYTTSTPPVGGYQLVPRDAMDITPSSTIALLGEVGQIDIQPTGFTLTWSTNLPGSSHVRYGTTPNYGQLASINGSTSQHSVTIDGAVPATTYHAQVFSVLGADTAWSQPGIYSTASADAGAIIVYFNQPVDGSVAQGPMAIDLGGAIDDTIRAYIDRAQLTLDIAVYNTTNNAIVMAVNDALQRGVQVRWIAEAGNSNSALANLDPAIPVLYRTDSGGSGMHNKFIIADADGGPEAHVLTGSLNFTNSGLFLDANNLVIVRDMALARAYRSEFNEMWGGPGGQPIPASSRFGPDKTNNTPHFFHIGGTPVQCWFSPSDGTTARIASALHSADQSIEFALFALTSSTLTTALVDRHAVPGVDVRGIVEEDDMNMYTYQTLLDAGVDVRPDGSPNYLHHKYAIVDRGLPASDPLVITGSHNWSFNAETQNDENTLILHSAALADQFHQEWHARWNTAVQVDDTGISGEGKLHLWPNPACHDLWASYPAPRAWNGTWRIMDAAGRILLEQHTQGGTLHFSISDLAPGTYIMTMTGADLRLSRNFVRLP